MHHTTPADKHLGKDRFRSLHKQTRCFLADHGWLLIGIAAILVYALGMLGFRQYYESFAQSKVAYTGWDLVHMSFQLFRLGTVVPAGPKPWLLELARTLAAIITLTAAIKALMLFFQEKLQRLRLLLWTNHVVICGLGEKGRQLALDQLHDGERVLVIDQNAQNEKYRRLLDQGVIVFPGDANRTSLLRKARVGRARHLFAVTPNDWTNMEIGLKAQQLMSEEKTALPAWRCRFDAMLSDALACLHRAFFKAPAPDDSKCPARRCFVHLVDNELHHLFAQRRVFSWIDGPVTINSFNIYENVARQLFRAHHPEQIADMLGQETVHLLIVGFGRMGQSVALQFAKIGHYAHKRPTRVTVIDKAADTRKEFFLGHQYPAYPKVCAIDFLPLDTEGKDFLNGSFLNEIGGAQSITQAIVCLDQESSAHVCALHLLRILDDVRCPLLVRVNAETQLVRLLGRENAAISATGEPTQRIHSFGTIADSCSAANVMNDEINEMAKQFHASYREMGDRPLSDPAMKEWEELDEDYKEANRAQADHLEVKLRAVGCKLVDMGDDAPAVVFSEDEIKLLARMEHARWNADRLLAGWTWVLAERNLAKKTSPFLVDWDELDDVDKKLNNKGKPTKEYDRDTVRQLAERLAKDHIRKKIVRVDSIKA